MTCFRLCILVITQLCKAVSFSEYPCWKHTIIHWSLLIRLTVINFCLIYSLFGASQVKNPPANARDASSIFWSEISPEVENGNPFQYSCLEKPTNKGAWQAAVHGVAKSPMPLSIHTGTCDSLF